MAFSRGVSLAVRDIRHSVQDAPRSLTVLHLAAPAAEGGLEAVVLELTDGLRARGHRVVLAAVQDVGTTSPLLSRVTDAGVEVLRLEVPSRAYLSELRLIEGTLAAVRPALLHTHGYRADLLGGLAARRAGVPWVATAHGFTGGDRKNRLYEWLQRRAFRRAEAVVAVSASVRDRLARAGVSPDRIHLMPNAWSPKPARTRAEARRQMGLPDGDPIIGWVGRLTVEKGADLFLEALAALPDRHWLAAVVGDGKERPALEARARELGIGDRVRWLGLIPRAASLYAAFDVWVLSSRTEGTPIALFEALSARVPVVATAVGGVPDVISSAEATLVRSGDPVAIAAGIREVLANPDAAGVRSEAGLLRLTEAFAPGAWLDAHLRLYRSVSRSRAPEA